MNRHILEHALIEHGFRIIRRGKHEIWSNGTKLVTLPYHRVVSYYTAKGILKVIGGNSV